MNTEIVALCEQTALKNEKKKKKKSQLEQPAKNNTS
jgi:hypothetical protein